MNITNETLVVINHSEHLPTEVEVGIKSTVEKAIKDIQEGKGPVVITLPPGSFVSLLEVTGDLSI